MERLYRRYHSSSLSVDYVECCDLAHCLRIWGEIANDKSLQLEMAKINKFSCAKPSRKSSRILHRNDAEYIWLCKSNALYAKVIQAGVYLPNSDNLPFSKGKLSAWSTVAGRNVVGPNGISGYYFGTSIDGFKKKTVVTNFLTLSQFYSSQLVIYRFNNKIYRFTVRNIIDRTANGLIDASHFQCLVDECNSGVLTEALPTIAAVKVGNISLLYFILLYVAQEILIGLGKIERHKVIK